MRESKIDWKNDHHDPLYQQEEDPEEKQAVVVGHCIHEREVRGTRIEVDMQKLEAELHNVVAVAALDNKDLQLGVDSFADSKVSRQLNSQRVLEN